jgi:Leucine-rich repeat (LRR) protein
MTTYHHYMKCLYWFKPLMLATLAATLIHGCGGGKESPSSAQPASPPVLPHIGPSAGTTEESFDNIEKALQFPEKATRLTLGGSESRHLSSRLGSLVNLKELQISCWENLEELPNEIGNLRNLQELIIDNGNGCQMNILIPPSIGQLSNLRILRLYGAIDPRDEDLKKPLPKSKIKTLPETITKLQNLEELDLGRNALTAVPDHVAALKGLKRLKLDYNTIHEIPPFVGELKNLQELSICSNGRVTLPHSLNNLKGLKVSMGNSSLKIKDQKKLRDLFPKTIFSFENEYDDESANEENSQ